MWKRRAPTQLGEQPRSFQGSWANTLTAEKEEVIPILSSIAGYLPGLSLMLGSTCKA
jgi:hypothetical protein